MLNARARARASRKGIRINLLIFFDSRFREQGITGGSRRIGVDFEHRSTSQRQTERRICSCFVSIQDPVGFDRLQSRPPVITRNGKPAASYGDASYEVTVTVYYEVTRSYGDS